MFDQPPDHDGDDDPIWDPSGWTPVFVGAIPGTPSARLIGHTRLQMPAHVVRRFGLTSKPDDPSAPYFHMHGQMILHPYRQGGLSIWAWHLENEEDRPYIPKFRPLAN